MRWRALALASVAVSLVHAGPAHAGLQLFEGSWVVKAFGNERTGGTGESEFYSAFGIPLGQQCNTHQPRCPFQSTPTDGKGNFSALGGSVFRALYCAPYSQFGSKRFTRYQSPSHCWLQPPRSIGLLTHGERYICIPAYRNPIFFTPSGGPKSSHCDPRSTSLGGYGSLGGGPGLAQRGAPITGQGVALTTRMVSSPRGFTLSAADSAGGIRGKRTGALPFDLPNAYRYTYARLLNAKGVFGPNLGPGSFSIPYQVTGVTVARVNVKQGAAKFGGTMRMLGALSAKACHYHNGGCSLGVSNWIYDAIGATAYTSAGEVTKGYQARGSTVFFNSGLGQLSTVVVYGSRFPWTTGSVTVTAVGRGPHKTVHYAMGYDNRTPTNGKGTIQLVSPVLTHWLSPGVSDDTGGVAILRIKFLPEPRAWAMLVAGLGLLAVARRVRG